MKSRTVFLSTILTTLACACICLADSVTIGAAEDSTFFFDGGVNGSGVSFFAGRTRVGSIRRTLLYFDIASQIPAGSTITNVSLTLRVDKSKGSGFSMLLHVLTEDWSEAAGSGIGAGRPSAAQIGDPAWTFNVPQHIKLDVTGRRFQSGRQRHTTRCRKHRPYMEFCADDRRCPGLAGRGHQQFRMDFENRRRRQQLPCQPPGFE